MDLHDKKAWLSRHGDFDIKFEDEVDMDNDEKINKHAWLMDHGSLLTNRDNHNYSVTWYSNHNDYIECHSDPSHSKAVDSIYEKVKDMLFTRCNAIWRK